MRDPVSSATAGETSCEPRLPNLLWALVPILTMVGLMLYVFGFVADSDVYDAAHMPLLCSIVVACIVGVANGRSFSYMMGGILHRLATSLGAILILLMVGLLISSFMISDTIPALIYYGLDLMKPSVFLPVGCILCAVVGMACGSSWTATATVGIAFMTIGTGLGINPALTAGMIISGAYVGENSVHFPIPRTWLPPSLKRGCSTTCAPWPLPLLLYSSSR